MKFNINRVKRRAAKLKNIILFNLFFSFLFIFSVYFKKHFLFNRFWYRYQYNYCQYNGANPISTWQEQNSRSETRVRDKNPNRIELNRRRISVRTTECAERSMVFFSISVQLNVWSKYKWITWTSEPRKKCKILKRNLYGRRQHPVPVLPTIFFSFDLFSFAFFFPGESERAKWFESWNIGHLEYIWRFVHITKNGRTLIRIKLLAGAFCAKSHLIVRNILSIEHAPFKFSLMNSI